MATTIEMGDTIVATSEQVSCAVEGEAAILNLKNGVYYGLNPIGARIWTLIREPKQVAQLRDQMLSEYEVEAGPLEADVRQLLADLAEHGLIEVKH
jgi:hypothetical protein